MLRSGRWSGEDPPGLGTCSAAWFVKFRVACFFGGGFKLRIYGLGSLGFGVLGMMLMMTNIVCIDDNAVTVINNIAMAMAIECC